MALRHSYWIYITECRPCGLPTLLLEVDTALDFTDAFAHLRTGTPCRDRIGLLNVLLAEGLNLILRKMAEATNTHYLLATLAPYPLVC